MLMVALLFSDRLGILDEALLFSKVPIRVAGCLSTTFAFSKCCSMTIVGGGVTGMWSSNSNEWASLLVAIPESSSSPNRKWWLWTVESVLSLQALWSTCSLTFALLAPLTRLFSKKSILPQTPGFCSPTRFSFHNLFVFSNELRLLKLRS